MRWYQHLQLVKRSGRGHDPLGVNATAPGEMTVECPLCPHPGCNMPLEWDDIPDEHKYRVSL